MRIENDPMKGYRIFLGDGKRGGYKAQDLGELVIAVTHYYGTSCKAGENPNCPLCRAINKEMEAMRKGKSWITA